MTGLLEGVRYIPSPNSDDRPAGSLPELIIVHGISMPPGEFGGDAIDALFTKSLDPAAHPAYAEVAALEVSSHFLIRRDGTITQYVPVSRRAWHAGQSLYCGRERCTSDASKPICPCARSPRSGNGTTRTAAGVNVAQCEKPEYPSASRRMEEEGTVGLRFLVGADGKVIESEVEKSSGYKRLDEAARAGLSKCQVRPAMVDGKPEQAWTTIRYVWRLE